MTLQGKGLMRFLFVAVVVGIKKNVNIYQVVGDEVERVHVVVFGCLAVLVHFGQLGQHGKIAHWQHQTAEDVVNQEKTGCRSFHILQDVFSGFGVALGYYFFLFLR